MKASEVLDAMLKEKERHDKAMKRIDAQYYFGLAIILIITIGVIIL